MQMTKSETIAQVQADQVLTDKQIADALGLTVPQVKYAALTGMRKIRLKLIAKKMQYHDCFGD
jgi:DNA-binding CsgD family transcriptional regulator